jgi:hypothetical protein
MPVARETKQKAATRRSKAERDGSSLPLLNAMIPLAIIASGVIIATAVFLADRYAIQRADDYSLWMADKLTGRLWICGVSPAKGNGCVRIPSKQAEPHAAKQ